MPRKSQDITGKSLVSFTFKGQKYETKYWRDLLLKLSSILAESHKEHFDDGPKNGMNKFKSHVNPLFRRFFLGLESCIALLSTSAGWVAG